MTTNTAAAKPLIERLAANESRFTLSEVAEMLSVGPDTVVAWHRRGVNGIRLDLVKIGGAWSCFYAELSRFLEEVRIQAEADTVASK
jgi:hypothetical protein